MKTTPVTSRELMTIFIVGSLLTLALGLVCSLAGPVPLRLEQGLWTDPIWHTRLSRLAAAALVGAGMAVAGLGIQGLLRNPLAEPYVLGIASGAGVGVRLGAFLLPWFAWLMPVSAFAGAVATCAIVYALARRRGHLDAYSLLLSGIIMNTFNYSLMLLFSMLADPFQVDGFTRWAMGEVPDFIPGSLLCLCATVIGIGSVMIFRRSAAYNVLTLGADVAQSSGISVSRLYAMTFLCAGGMTAAAVALAGPVSFVGLIVPHLARMTWGADNRRLAIACGFAGACLLMGADSLCRIVGHAAGVGKIPVGVVLALCGAPLFIWLMRHRFMEGAGK